MKETEKQVVIKNISWSGREGARREAKKSQYGSYFDTWEEAHQFLADKSLTRIEAIRNSLEKEQEKLRKITAMKPAEQR